MGAGPGLQRPARLGIYVQVKVIERGWDQARSISEQLNKAIVLHGDAAEEELLLEEVLLVDLVEVMLLEEVEADAEVVFFLFLALPPFFLVFDFLM